MTDDELFLLTFDELDERLQLDERQLDALALALPLRKLLVEGTIVAKAANPRRLKVTYRISDVSPPDRGDWHPNETLYPDDEVGVIEPDRQALLAQRSKPAGFVALRLICDSQRHPALFERAVIDDANAKGGLMEKPYTHTTWRVKAGSEDEFVKRWSEWVDWSHREGLEAPALLLRDLENPQAFISFGPWVNVTAVRGWRALAGYQERVARLSEVLDSFEPRTLEIVARR